MNRRRTPPVLAILAGLLALYLVAPFIAGVGLLPAADWRSADLAGLAGACLVSLASASLATLLVTIGGAPLGYLLARRQGRAMTLLGFIVQLPLALPPLASGALLLFLFGYASPLGRLTQGALTDSFAGIVLAEAFVAAPFLIIAARSAFAAVDPNLEDVAATLGRRPLSVFLRVDLPLARRVILAGMLLTWLRAFGEFGATVMVAYHPYSLPVFSYVAFGSEGLPAMVPALAPALAAAVAVMAASVLLTRSASPREAKAADAAALEDVAFAAQGAGLGMNRGATLDFAFHRRLSGFELDVAWRTQARRLAVLGPSGSGKSMTLRLLAGLDARSADRLAIGARELSGLPPYARDIAYVPQNYGLFPHLSVADQIRFAVGSDAKAARFWIERLGLTRLQDRRPAELSLGQQQRVALARALARPAELLMLDEPLSALDAPLRARLREDLRALQQDIGGSTILVTHDPNEALLLADEVLVLDAGRQLQTGPASTVFLRPANETVARLLGAENVNHGRTTGDGMIALRGGIAIEIAGPSPPSPGRNVGWAVKSERIRPAPDGRYPACVLQRGDPVAGGRTVVIGLGEAVLRLSADPSFPDVSACRVDIDPLAIQVWPID